MREESWVFYLCHGEDNRSSTNSERDTGEVAVGKKTEFSFRDKPSSYSPVQYITKILPSCSPLSLVFLGVLGGYALKIHGHQVLWFSHCLQLNTGNGVYLLY